MNCANYRDQLAALALGALEPAEKHAVELHLSTCAACRATLAELKSVTESLEDVQIRETHRVHEHAAAAIIRAQKPAGL